MDLDHIIMNEVQSSNIEAVGHDVDRNILLVRFHNGVTYKCSPITEQGYRSMLNSPSVGKWYHQNIRQNDGVEVERVGD